MNLTATAPDPKTVVIKSSVDDPKLPTMDMYLLPKHIWEQLGKDGRDKDDGTQGVGSGPFVLDKFEKGQFARFKANPNYYKGRPAVDQVVLRKFNNPDAMVAALKSGELDAAEDVPGAAFNQLEKDPDFVAVQGYQGAMTEIGINGGDGLKKPHPALLDPKVREAIGHAIDKQTIVTKVLDGLGKPAGDLSVSPNPAWTPEIPGRTASTSTSKRQSRSSRTPATRTPMATASARCRAAASRSTSATPSGPTARPAHRPPSSSPAGSRRSASPRRARSTRQRS